MNIQIISIYSIGVGLGVLFLVINLLSKKKGYISEIKRKEIMRKPQGYKRPTVEDMRKSHKAVPHPYKFTQFLKDQYTLNRLNKSHV